jgi:hypothetical protein
MGRNKKYNTEEERLQVRYSQIRNQRLKMQFGITLDDYNQMLFNQNGCCAICDKHHTEFNRGFAVDHCHTTDKIRGLLCINCNLAIGNFYDNITILKNAIKYIKQHGF